MKTLDEFYLNHQIFMHISLLVELLTLNNKMSKTWIQFLYLFKVNKSDHIKAGGFGLLVLKGVDTLN